MNITIVANFPERLDGKLVGRFVYLANMLCQKGHSVNLLTSDFDHGTKKTRIVNYDAYPFKITVLHELGYPNNISLKRLLSHYVWGRNVAKYLQTNNLHDVVYCAIPSLTAARSAAKFCKKHNIKYIVDVQDLWPEAFCMTIKNKLLQKGFLPMKWYVDKAYAAADIIIGVSETYVNRALAVNKKSKSGLSVFLGNDGATFENGKTLYRINRNDNELWMCYIGTLGYSYDIPHVIDALEIIKKRGSLTQPIRFKIMGGGPLAERFKQYAMEKNISCDFLGLKPYPEMVGIMCSCDMVINPIVKGSAASIINKVGDYALSGLPVINTQESPEYRALVEKYNCGINCRCENAEDVADAIERLVLSPELRTEMGKNAAKLGSEKFDRRNTYQTIVSAIESCKQ